MKTENKNTHYMLLFKGNEWHKGLSPEEMQQVAAHWMDWFKGLLANGKAVGGNPLEKGGKLVSTKNGRVTVDGPFAESKEAVGGYFLLRVDTEEEAIAIAKQCPGLAHGAQVEVRLVAGECPVGAEAELQMASELVIHV